MEMGVLFWSHWHSVRETRNRTVRFPRGFILSWKQREIPVQKTDCTAAVWGSISGQPPVKTPRCLSRPWSNTKPLISSLCQSRLPDVASCCNSALPCVNALVWEIPGSMAFPQKQRETEKVWAAAAESPSWRVKVGPELLAVPPGAPDPGATSWSCPRGGGHLGNQRVGN